VYNDYWMLDQGFIQRERFGDLRDLIARRHREHAVATVNADETVLNAYQRMKLYDVSQLPVLKDGKIVASSTRRTSCSGSTIIPGTSRGRCPRRWKATWSPCRRTRRSSS